MTQHIERRAAPSLLSAPRPVAGTLTDLLYEGFYALFLLRSGCAPKDSEGFDQQLTQFLLDVDQKARVAGIPAEDVESARYAFCAAADEIVLRSPFPVREAWETRPLQLRIFGDQLAGEHFFEKMDDLRHRGSAHLQVLEVYHMCLLLGFQGKYALAGQEKLKYLTAHLGEEIARMRGRTRAFAPHAARPDNVSNKLRSDRSLMILAALFAASALCAFGAFRYTLARDADKSLAGYNDLVKLPPKAASVTITLP